VAAVSLNLRADIEERLQMLAKARGVSLDAFLERIVEEEAGIAESSRLGAEEWGRQLEEWADGVPSAPLIPDEALSREKLYPDRW
jgi:hypothetical protein